MSSSTLSTIKALASAGIPRTGWGRRNADLPLDQLKEHARALVSRETDRTSQCVMAIYHEEPDQALFMLESAGRELVFAGMHTRYLPYERLCYLLRTPNGQETLEKLHARGAILVPDLPAVSQVNENAMEKYKTAVGFLVSQVYDGGVLGLLLPRPVNRLVKNTYPVLLERLVKQCSICYGGL